MLDFYNLSVWSLNLKPKVPGIQTLVLGIFLCLELTSFRY